MAKAVHPSVSHPAACYTGLKSPNSQSFGVSTVVQVQELPATVGNSRLILVVEICWIPEFYGETNKSVMKDDERWWKMMKVWSFCCKPALLAVSWGMFGEFYAISFQLLDCFLKEDAKKHPRLPPDHRGINHIKPPHRTTPIQSLSNRSNRSTPYPKIGERLPRRWSSSVLVQLWQYVTQTSRDDFHFKIFQIYLDPKGVPHPGCEKL